VLYLGVEPQEVPQDFQVRRGMGGKGHRAKCPAARAKIGADSQWEHNLIGQIPPHRHASRKILFGLAERFHGNFLSLHASPPEAGAHLGNILRFQFDNHNVARPVGVAALFDRKAVFAPAGLPGDSPTLALGNVRRQIGEQNPDAEFVSKNVGGSYV